MAKNIEANAKALHALKLTLNDEYLSKVSNIDSTFVVWNILITLGEQTTHDKESDSNEGSTTSNIRVTPRIVLLLFAKGDYSVLYYKSRIKLRNPK